MTETEPVLVERDGHILILTLNRPDRLNALNRPMQHRLHSLYLEADADPEVRVILITGAGKAFCSGADIGHLDSQNKKSLAEQLVPPPPFTARQAKIFKPTICAINGVCAGAGLHFVAESDLCLASEAATFLDTHVNVGQVSAQEPIGLLRMMPMTRVLRMVMLGRAERLTAAQALDCHMITEVQPPDRLMVRARELAGQIAEVSPAAVKTSLQAIWESLELPLTEAMSRGFETLIRYREHPDAKEGPAAFLEKRPPKWTP